MDIARDELTKKFDEISVEKLQVSSFYIFVIMKCNLQKNYLAKYNNDI